MDSLLSRMRNVSFSASAHSVRHVLLENGAPPRARTPFSPISASYIGGLCVAQHLQYALSDTVSDAPLYTTNKSTVPESRLTVAAAVIPPMRPFAAANRLVSSVRSRARGESVALVGALNGELALHGDAGPITLRSASHAGASIALRDALEPSAGAVTGCDALSEAPLWPTGASRASSAPPVNVVGVPSSKLPSRIAERLAARAEAFTAPQTECDGSSESTAALIRELRELRAEAAAMEAARGRDYAMLGREPAAFALSLVAGRARMKAAMSL